MDARGGRQHERRLHSGRGQVQKVEIFFDHTTSKGLIGGSV